MNKTIMGILAFICVSVLSIGAFASEIPNSEKVPVTYVASRPAINIDGMSGEISLMTTSGVPARTVAISNVGKYYGCHGVIDYAFDNAIELRNGEHNSVGDYILDYQTCQLMLKSEKVEMAQCGWKHKNIDVDGDGIFDYVHTMKKWINGTKQSVPITCEKHTEFWQVIDLNAPAN